MLSLVADRRLRNLIRALFLATALLAPSPARAQLPALDELASRLGGDIVRSGKKTVIVLDFLGPQGGVPAVGPFLADRLSEALARTAKDFRVLDRSRLNVILEEQKVPAGDALNPTRVAKLVGPLVGAEIVITGSIQAAPDTLALSVSVRDVTTGKELAQGAERIVRSKEIDNLPFRSTGWLALAPARPGQGGVGFPVCIHCPIPEYSRRARERKYEGRVVLQVIVTPEGRATNITLVKGPGLGLDEKAIEAVRNWRFKPAPGPDGRPVPVQVLIEVTFRLLW